MQIHDWVIVANRRRHQALGIGRCWECPRITPGCSMKVRFTASSNSRMRTICVYIHCSWSPPVFAFCVVDFLVVFRFGGGDSAGFGHNDCGQRSTLGLSNVGTKHLHDSFANLTANALAFQHVPSTEHAFSFYLFCRRRSWESHRKIR